jgi:PAS domain S-box-containing protein
MPQMKPSSINDTLKRDIVYMRCFRELVEQAPCLMAVLAPDLEAKVLYANGAFGRLLGVPAASVMGNSLWGWIHEEGRALLQAAFTTAILSKAAPLRPVRCRMRRKRADDTVEAEVVFKRGTQGVVCTLWIK